MNKRACFFSVNPSPYQQDLARQFQELSSEEVFFFYYVGLPHDRQWSVLRLGPNEQVLEKG